MIKSVSPSLYVASRLIGTSGHEGAVQAAQRALAEAQNKGQQKTAEIWADVQYHLDTRGPRPGLSLDIRV